VDSSLKRLKFAAKCGQMHPKNISILDYTYELPASKIASYPLEERDASKLLVVGAPDSAGSMGDASAAATGRAQTFTESTYFNLDQALPSGTLLVHNDTKVVAARLFLKKKMDQPLKYFAWNQRIFIKTLPLQCLQKKKCCGVV